MMLVRCSMLLATISGLLLYSSDAYALQSLRREEIAGVWHLTLSSDSFLKSDDDGGTKGGGEGVLLKLKQDGSFVQYGAEQTVEKQEGRMGEWLQQAQARGSDGNKEEDDDGKLRGSWDYDMNEKKLLLATDHPLDADHQRVYDTLLTGEVVVNFLSSLSDDAHSSTTTLLSEDDNSKNKEENPQDIYLSIPNGSVWVGKFMYPRNHPSFFDQPMFHPDQTGTFALRQILGMLNTRREEHTKEKKKVRYRKRDFYGRKFFLTTELLKPARPKPKLVWSRTAGGYVEEPVGTQEDPLMPFDVRVMPIQFFANNTFCAIGTNKILRGRYGTTGEEKEKLWFSVSLFGTGRSVKGSIFR